MADVKVTVKMPAELRDALDEELKEIGVSRSELIKRVMRNWFKWRKGQAEKFVNP
jgi:metal-responsive CopG/Arc/MetJ family transcriptional regulator